jgi:hypothetical protein
MATSDTKAPRRAELPPQPDDFVVFFRDRRLNWLSRLVGRVAVLILGWRSANDQQHPGVYE